MKKNFLVGSLCTTALTAVAALSVIGCSGDDDYYEGGNYTLANKRVTRSEMEGPNSNPSPSVSYRGGSEEVELNFDCNRLYFDVSWGDGWNTNDVHVSYSRSECNSGYQVFYDENDDKHYVDNVSVTRVTNEGPAVISGNKIHQSITIHYTQKVEKKDSTGRTMRDKYGNTIYTQSSEQTATDIVTLDISGYRKTDTTF